MKKQRGITLIALIITIIVMLILAGVAINLTVNEDGVINKAEEAVETTTIAQIKERAELVKLAIDLEIKSNQLNNVVFTQEFLTRAARELDGRIEGSRVITKDEKYAVSLKGSNSEVEVSRYATDFFDIGQILTPNCEIDENAITIKLNQNSGIDLTKYTEKVIENASAAEKERGTLEYLSTTNDFEDIDVNSLDEVVVLGLKAEFPDITHDKLEDWVNDPEVQEYANQNMQSILKGEKLNKDHFYQYAFGSTKAEFIDSGYKGYLLYCVGLGLSNAQENKGLKITVIKDNQTKIAEDEIFNADTGYTISNPENGIYEYTISVWIEEYIENPPYKLELANEKIVVNN